MTQAEEIIGRPSKLNSYERYIMREMNGGRFRTVDNRTAVWLVHLGLAEIHSVSRGFFGLGPMLRPTPLGMQVSEQLCRLPIRPKQTDCTGETE